MKLSASSTLINAALAIAAVLVVSPLIWMVSASFMQPGEANIYPPRFFPSKISFESYQSLFTRMNLGRSFFNSTLLATAVTALSILLNSMAGYAFAKLRFSGRDHLFKLLLGALVIPIQVAMLPSFLMLRTLGLINSYWGVILPTMASVFGIFLVRQYALSISDELLDAARVDGASEFKIYWTIILPICRPALITLGVFTFLSTWNDFLWPLIILTDDSRHTLPVALANLAGEHVQDTEVMMAGAVITVLPVVLLFLVLQRYYIEGIMQGSIKE